MTSCCSGYPAEASAQFDRKKADADLARYRQRGPDPTTRMLIDGIREAWPDLATLLDVGAGIGILTHELLALTNGSATLVDASDAFLETARQEAERRGHRHRCQLSRGDFVELAPTLAPAAVVAMDRVVCCYPAFVPLLEAALGHAERGFAFSYPRDRWYVRAGVALENLPRRLGRNAFRVLVHPPAEMQALVESRGFALVSRRSTLAWSVEVWRRASTT